MAKMGTLVALAVTLALGCDSAGGALDAGSDAQALGDAGLDVAVDDAGEDAGSDAGWCLDSPCIQRLRLDGTCVENVRNDFPCDPGPLAYDGRCNAVGECVGTPCECTADSGCCDGCHIIEEDEPCNEPLVEGPTMCDFNVRWEIRARICDGNTTACGDRYVVTSIGENQCPQGFDCNDGAPMGMRCRPQN